MFGYGVHEEHTGLTKEDQPTEEHHRRLGHFFHHVAARDHPELLEEHAEPENGDHARPEHPDGDNKDEGLHGMHKLGHALKEKMRHANHRIHDILNIDDDVRDDSINHGLYPELDWDAELRRSNALHPGEVQYLSERRRRIVETGALAKFLGLPEGEEVHPDDVPIIGLGGSGGGYRANLGFLATFLASKETGLWDLISYVAGVSGSCWAIAAYLTFGNRDCEAVLDHFAANSGHHPVSPKAFNAVMDSPHGADFLFGPLLLKLRTGVSLALLDLYATFIHSYMFLPVQGRIEAGETKAELRKEWFQWSKVWDRSGINTGEEPFPILTAVRHERPWRDWKSKTEPFDTKNHASKEHQTAENAWWQWFEFNALEVGCDELEGWVPIWSFGRKFGGGKSLLRMPEQSLALILGLSTSAPAGPLSSYLGTLYRNLPHNIFGSAIRSLTHLVEHIAPVEAERFGDHHPIHACNEANPFFGAKAEPNRGQGIENSPRLHLIDAGMGNNMPTYSFVHPNRDVDVIINCDFSSDVQKDSALERLNDFGTDKGLEFHPRKKFPPIPPATVDKAGKILSRSAEDIGKIFADRYAQVIDGVPLYADQTKTPEGFHRHREEGVDGGEEILYNKRHQPQARRGVTVVYCACFPNKIQPEYDPSTAPWSSSYNLVWTPEQVHTLAKTQKQNIIDGMDYIRGVVREAYERRKKERLAGVKPFQPAVPPPPPITEPVSA